MWHLQHCDDLTIEKLHSGNYASRTRNRAIANIFKEAGIIEKYGSRIQRIKDGCKAYVVEEPLFEEFVHYVFPIAMAEATIIKILAKISRSIEMIRK